MATTKKQLLAAPEYAGNPTEFEVIDLDSTGTTEISPPCICMMPYTAGTIDFLGKDNTGTSHITSPTLAVGQWFPGVVRSIGNGSTVRTILIGR